MIGRVRWGEAGGTYLRAALAAGVCLAGTVVYLTVLGRHYPPSTWLSWRLGILYAWLFLFCCGCVGAGSFLVERLLPEASLPRLEAAVLSMAAGVVAFVLAMYVAGACAWFGPTFAVSLQVAMALLGVRSIPRLLLRRADVARTGPVWPGNLAFGAGALGLGLVYLGMLTPEAINYDATWSHLTIAQDYAREGRIVSFPGDYNKQVPHLASIVYSWGFMVPGLDVVGRWMLAQHLEFVLFVWTLASVSATVRWVVQAPVRGTWSAFFLFPSIFVYDSNLGAAADHVLAFFGLPALLAARHFFLTLGGRPAVLLGLLLGGAALTKYQALYFIAPLCGLLGLRVLLLLISEFRKTRTPRWRLLLGPLALAGSFVVVVAPHFIKNAVFYGNPVYPFMQRAFASSHPISPLSWLYFENMYLDPTWVPTGTFVEKLRSSAELFFTFSFVPHYSFTGGVPSFGSLFTLLLPCVLFLPGTKRLRFVLAVAAGGILMWAWTFRVDRNLQIILPLLVAGTAALIIQVWRLGWIARVGLVPLVVLQLAWGADAPFYSGHVRIKDSIDIIRSGFERRASARFDRYRHQYRDLEQALPRDARVLVHAAHPSLGIDRDVVLDWVGFQALIQYDQLQSAHELHIYYRERGITHLVYTPHERLAASKQELVLWQDYISRYAPPAKRFGNLSLVELPKDAPPASAAYRVLCLGIDGYVDGLYDITDLGTPDELPAPLRQYRPPRSGVASVEEARERIRLADAVLVGARGGYEGGLTVELRRFSLAGRYGAIGVYVKKRSVVAQVGPASAPQVAGNP